MSNRMTATPSTCTSDIEAEWNWSRPGVKELTVTGSYITTVGPRLHEGFGGTSQLDVIQAEFVQPDTRDYKQLEHALHVYITETLNTKVVDFLDDGLAARITNMKDEQSLKKRGFWHRLWYRLGDSREMVEPWLGLIPNEYGVAVLKTGFAIVLKLAENSTKQAERIFETFDKLQSALLQLHRDRFRFQKDPNIIEAVNKVHQVVVDAVKDLVQLLASEERSMRNKITDKLAKLKPGNKEERQDEGPGIDGILQKVDDEVKKFNETINLARDRVIERTEQHARYNSLLSTLTHRDVILTKNGVDGVNNRLSAFSANFETVISDTAFVRKQIDHQTKRQEEIRKEDTKLHAEFKEFFTGFGDILQSQLKEIQKVVEDASEWRRMAEEFQRESRNKLLQILMDQKNKEDVNRKSQPVHSRFRKPASMVSLDRLGQILAQPTANIANPSQDPAEYKDMFQHSATDLRQALSCQSHHDTSSQAQAQSLLARKEFKRWMADYDPSLLLVDASIDEDNHARLSSISLLCGTLVTTLLEVYPEGVVVIHFFCGLHSSRQDPWYGPSGLMRSLIVQVLMHLVGMDPDIKGWSLDFIDTRSYLKKLEMHDLVALCQTFHDLVRQFPPETRVYVIVDSISCFDTSSLRADLRVVIECLDCMVGDEGLVPVLKVLLTNPGTSTRNITNMSAFRGDNSSRRVVLSEHDVSHAGDEISGLVVQRNLLRAPSPRPPPTLFWSSPPARSLRRARSVGSESGNGRRKNYDGY